MEKYVGKRKKSRARPVGYYLQERRRILFDDVYIVLTLDILMSEEIKNISMIQYVHQLLG